MKVRHLLVAPLALFLVLTASACDGGETTAKWSTTAVTSTPTLEATGTSTPSPTGSAADELVGLWVLDSLIAGGATGGLEWTFDVRMDGTFTMRMTSPDGIAGNPDDGTWTTDGSTIAFTPDRTPHTVFEFVLDGDSRMVARNGVTTFVKS